MRQKILIVDDSATARALLKLCFAEYPEYEIIQASEWQDAIEKAQLHTPFIIVLDYNMPEKSGSELAQLMKEKGIKAYFVLSTANTQQSVIDEVTKLDFVGVLEKPVSVENIHSLIGKLK